MITLQPKAEEKSRKINPLKVGRGHIARKVGQIIKDKRTKRLRTRASQKRAALAEG